MDQDQLRILASCLRFPEKLIVTDVFPTAKCLEVHLACQDHVAACPLCQQDSERVHSRYLRTVADVPCGLCRVILSLTVRKFVCSTSTCPRKIFTERLPELVETYARKTIRLIGALQAIGLVAGGETGTRAVHPCSTLFFGSIAETHDTVLAQQTLRVLQYPLLRVDN